ncbi:MAG: hypothetical protein AB8I08_37365 [Sandaracinaceae bacterium]
MRVRLMFDKPGFFLNDPRVTVEVGERVLYDGSLGEGFDVSVELPPGEHQVRTAILIGSLARRQDIALPLGGPGYRDAAAVEAKLSYSRFWGNFSKKVSLSTQSR